MNNDASNDWTTINGDWAYQPANFDQGFAQHHDHDFNLRNANWNHFDHQDHSSWNPVADNFNQQPWPAPQINASFNQPGMPMPAFHNFNNNFDQTQAGFDPWRNQNHPHPQNCWAKQHRSPERLAHIHQRLSTLRPSLRSLRKQFESTRYTVVTMLNALSPLVSHLLATKSEFHQCANHYKRRRADQMFEAMVHLRERVGRRAREIQGAWTKMEHVRERMLGVGVQICNYEEEMEGMHGAFVGNGAWAGGRRRRARKVDTVMPIMPECWREAERWVGYRGRDVERDLMEWKRGARRDARRG